MEASSAPSPESQSSYDQPLKKESPLDSQSLYDQPLKKECRRLLIEHAVKHLTKERDTSVCVRRGHVRKVWRELQMSKEAFDFFTAEERQNIEKEISQWELFHKSQVQIREPSDLRVCYLAGDDPTKDLEVLVDLGILPQNVWAVEKNSKMLEEAWKSIASSNFRNIRLFKGDILVFLKDFQGQFDIIYFDACGTLPAAKQTTLKFVGYVFLYNKLTSPGALITNFSFPPELQGQIQQQQETPTDSLTQDKTEMKTDDEPTQNLEAKPAYSERDKIRNLTEGYLRYRLTNTSEVDTHDRARTDEENYGDYITFQVIDSAYLYIPAQRMLSSTKSGQSHPLWDQIFSKKEKFIRNISTVQESVESISKTKFSKAVLAALTNLHENKPGKSIKFRIALVVVMVIEYLMQSKITSYLEDLGSKIQEMSKENNLCKAWIKEIFPDLSLLNPKNSLNVPSVLLTHLLSHSYDFIIKFANDDLLTKCFEPLNKALECRNKFPKFCKVLNSKNTTSMVAGLLYGQMAYPSFPVVDKLLRLRYTAKQRQMFSDVFIFDKCRYLYEQFPTVDCSHFAVSEIHQQMVFRMVVDGLRKHLENICHSDVFKDCIVSYFYACVPGEVPERQKVAELITCNKLKEEGIALVNVEKYEEAIAKFKEYCNLWPHNAVIYIKMAHCCLKLNRPEDAISGCDNALHLNVRNAEAFYIRAMAFKMQSNYHDARLDLEDCLEIEEYDHARKELDECLKLASG